MAISFVGDAENSAANGGNVTVDISGIGLQEDDYAYVFAGIGSDSGDTVSLGVQEAGYSESHNSSHTDTDRITFLVAKKKMGATPDTSVTVEVTNGDSSMGHTVVVQGWRGVDGSTPEDATLTSATGGQSGSKQPDSPSITTVTDNARVISAAAKNTSDGSLTSSGLPTGYGNFQSDVGNDTFDATVAVGDKEVASAGAEDPSGWTGGTNFETANGAWIAVSVALRPAATGSNLTLVKGSLTLSGKSFSLGSNLALQAGALALLGRTASLGEGYRLVKGDLTTAGKVWSFTTDAFFIMESPTLLLKGKRLTRTVGGANVALNIAKGTLTLTGGIFQALDNIQLLVKANLNLSGKFMQISFAEPDEHPWAEAAAPTGGTWVEVDPATDDLFI